MSFDEQNLNASETLISNRLAIKFLPLLLGACIYGLCHQLIACIPSPWTPAITANLLGFYSFIKVLFLFPCLVWVTLFFFRICKQNARGWFCLLVLTSCAVYPLAGLPFEILAESWTLDTSEMEVIDTSQPFSPCSDQGSDQACNRSHPLSSKLITFRPDQQLSLRLDLEGLNAGSTDGFFSTLTTVSGARTSFRAISTTRTQATQSRKPDWITPVRIIPFAEPYFWRSQSNYRSRLLQVDKAGAFQMVSVWLILLPSLTSFVPLLVYALYSNQLWPALGLYLLWAYCFTPWLRWLLWL